MYNSRGVEIPSGIIKTTMADFYGIGNTMLSAATFGLNNLFADWQSSRTAQRNYQYGEMAAANSDRRTRALYNDFYSPEALLKQYEKTGLSPSVMFGGTPGQGGMSGAQGTGAGISGVPFAPLSMIDAAQAAALNAQTEKTKAETQNINVDTERQEIQKGIEELNAEIWKDQNKIFVKGFTDPEGNTITLYDKAAEFNSFEDFAKWARDNYFLGQKESELRGLRDIFYARAHYNREIATLGSEELNANFQKQVIEAMSKEGFADMNAKAAVQHLRANVETGKLTQEQKGAWNDLLNDLEKKYGTTAKNVMIVLTMFLDRAASNYHMPNITTNNNTHEHIHMKVQ